MKQIATIFLLLVILVSCHHSGQRITEVNGEINPTEIADDTSNQLAIEGSYEYSKTLNVSDNLAYDIFAYGAPVEGNYIIIRRTANKADTLIKTERHGIFEDAWLTHLQKGHLGEIVIVNRVNTDSSFYRNLLIYGISNEWQLVPVKYSPLQGEIMDNNYHGRDSFYLQQNQIIRQYPLYATGDNPCCPSGGRIRMNYEMQHDTLVQVGKMEMDIQ